MDSKEFRLVVYQNAPESSRFYGGRAAASPLAYYYHVLKYGKVFLGTGFVFQGLGKYHSSIKDYFDEAKVLDKLPAKIDCDGEKVIFSDVGYIYQNYDPLYSSIQNGIFCQYKIEKMGKGDSFKSTEQERYVLSSTKIGKKEYNEDETERKWKCLVSDFKLIKLKKAPLFNEKVSQLFKIYRRDNTESPFCDEERTPTLPRNNAFVHLEKGSSWGEIDGKFVKEAKLSPSEIIDHQIKNNHIRESLVHEMMKVLIAKEGWYINFELPVKNKKKNGRIDFLIKKSPDSNDPWSVIEVKLLDNPDAVEQLKNYIDAIRYEVRRKEDNSKYYWLLWDGKDVKKIKGIILCAKPANDGTIAEAKDNDFDVWTYKFYLGYRKSTHRIPRLGIKIYDSEKRIILKTKLKSLRKWETEHE